LNLRGQIAVSTLVKAFAKTQEGEKGSAVFSGTFRTTTGIHRRFKSKLLRDFDHPIFVSKGPTALRA
jgi:hypothetical protein